MGALDVFRYGSDDVRVVLDEDGEPWFVGRDVCSILGLDNASMALGRLDRDGVSSAEVIDSLGRKQTASTVSEAGLYELVFQSRREEAKAFRRWVTHDVLPAIRRTGQYVAPAPEDDASLVARALQASSRMLEQKDARIAVLTPPAEAWEALADAKGDFSVARAAKMLSRAGIPTGRDRLFESMKQISWVFRNRSGHWEPYQTAVDQGYLADLPPREYPHPRTGEPTLGDPTVRVTIRGLERLRVRLGRLDAPALHAVEGTNA